MKIYLIVAALALTLAACVTPEEQAASDLISEQGACLSLGIGPGNPQLPACLQLAANNIASARADRAARRYAAAMALQSAGATIAAPAAQPAQPQHCYSRHYVASGTKGVRG